jgi:hypothetical protein
LEALVRTNDEERQAVITLFQHTCPNGLPENVHMNIDLLSRLTGWSEGKLVRTFAGLRSLGFYARSFKRRTSKAHLGEEKIISVEWLDMHRDLDEDRNATDVAFQMPGIQDFGHCEDCALAALRRLDFSHLSSSTLTMGASEVETGRRIQHIGRELQKIHPIEVEISGTPRAVGRKKGQASKRKRRT